MPKIDSKIWINKKKERGKLSSEWATQKTKLTLTFRRALRSNHSVSDWS